MQERTCGIQYHSFGGTWILLFLVLNNNLLKIKRFVVADTAIVKSVFIFKS
jgi:hypothetical protein